MTSCFFWFGMGRWTGGGQTTDHGGSESSSPGPPALLLAQDGFRGSQNTRGDCSRGLVSGQTELRTLKASFILICMCFGAWLALNVIPRGLQVAYKFLDPSAGTIENPLPKFDNPVSIVAIVIFGATTMGLVALLLVTGTTRMVTAWRVMSQGERATVFVSIIVGVGLSIPFHMLTFSFGPSAVFGSLILMLALIGLSYAALKTMEESMPWFRSGGKIGGRIKIFDTSVIIDGRIYEIAKAGFLEGKLYIPGFVLKELQSIADNVDGTKRQRGRRGLDILRNLQHDFHIEIGTQDKLAGDPSDSVDTKLVNLAKALGASLVTNDFNLNKVAQVHGVRVLNVNDLALSIRPQYLPNDVLHVKVEREGTQPGQGVGFLDDGTMVVIEDAYDLLGQQVDVRVTQVHQSTTGRMIFGILEGTYSSEHKPGKQIKG